MKRLLIFFVLIAFCGTPSEKNINEVQSNNLSKTTITTVSETQIQEEISLYKNSIAEYIDLQNFDSVILKNYKICCKDNTYPANGAKPFGYIDVYEDRLFFLANTGELMYSNLDSFDQNDLQIPQFLIETNIKTITNKYNFYNGFRRINTEAIYDNIGQNGWGESFKDILVIDEKLYISFTEQINQKCLKMSIIVGDINLQYIEFEKLYSTQDCIDPNTEPYNAQQASGRLLHNESSNKLFFGVGGFKKFQLPQDSKSEYGKVISIDLFNNQSQIISMGHRNIQGMALIDEKTIIATEHGPRGGDEINIISTNSLENYGWPISSYGDHYSNYLKETYASVAPLNKNHVDFGFVEPVFYFTYDEINSNGFSQIISNYFDSSIDYFVTSLNGRTIYNLKINNELADLTQFIQTEERIRDIVFVEKYNFYVLLQEDTPKISILLQK
tara:strand:- start:44 stop:1372 length:1329 start_codon:yes stop_codon:yes gene_type:complete